MIATNSSHLSRKGEFLFTELLVVLLLNIKHQETRCFSVCVQINNEEYLCWHIRMSCQHFVNYSQGSRDQGRKQSDD